MTKKELIVKQALKIEELIQDRNEYRQVCGFYENELENLLGDLHIWTIDDIENIIRKHILGFGE